MRGIIAGKRDPMSAKMKKVIAEIGPDMPRFKSAKHFASWLGLYPGAKIPGGKVLSGASMCTANCAAQAPQGWRAEKKEKGRILGKGGGADGIQSPVCADKVAFLP